MLKGQESRNHSSWKMWIVWLVFTLFSLTFPSGLDYLVHEMPSWFLSFVILEMFGTLVLSFSLLLTMRYYIFFFAWSAILFSFSCNEEKKAGVAFLVRTQLQWGRGRSFDSCSWHSFSWVLFSLSLWACILSTSYLIIYRLELPLPAHNLCFLPL